ncbi:MAG TPA: hypothetical protein VET88_08580 [Gammaproteobacteria bacterium]|nr:hypothetical protein [Gammaproteobacteria bacterium]
MKTASKWLGFFLLTGAACSAFSTDLSVRVFERGGNAPLTGVAVCLGTPARLDQFGAMLTDPGGYAVFSDVPQASLLITASKPGYKAEQENMVTSNMNRMLVLSLSSGGGGAQCQLDSGGGVQQASGLNIGRFAINNGAAQTGVRTVTLENRVAGEPTQYRASERADLLDAQWQPYSGKPAFELSDVAGTRVVYFQVRRHATINGADIEVLSPVVRDSIRYSP